MKARDPNHKLFGNACGRLSAVSLMREDGSIHSTIRNVVLSAVEGTGLDMRIVSPIDKSRG